VEVVALPLGDYSIPGFEDRVAVERKTLDDLISCLMGENRRRFERELARGRFYELFAVVVEASLASLAGGRYRSEMKAHAALQSIIAFQVRYRVPFVWAGSRAAAEYFTYWFLSKYRREVSERFKRAIKTESKGGSHARQSDRRSIEEFAGGHPVSVGGV
jgi:ERCC4-type nuclease